MTPKESRNVLIVEDEALIAMELSYLLEDLGHRVLGIGASVDRALTLIDQYHDDLDLVILDASLGGVPALEVAQALGRGHIPYVVASGYSREDLGRLGFDASVTIAKPYHASEIAAALAARVPS